MNFLAKVGSFFIISIVIGIALVFVFKNIALAAVGGGLISSGVWVTRSAFRS